MKTLYQGKEKGNLKKDYRTENKTRSYLGKAAVGLTILSALYLGEGILNYHGSQQNERMAKASGVPVQQLSRLQEDLLPLGALIDKNLVKPAKNLLDRLKD